MQSYAQPVDNSGNWQKMTEFWQKLKIFRAKEKQARYQ